MENEEYKKATCGGCKILDIGPKKRTSKTPTLNLFLTFEEALKLQAGLAEGLQRMNRWDRRKASPHLTISVKIAGKRITVHDWFKYSV